MTYEDLLSKYCNELTIIEMPLPGKLQGLYADGVIAINSSLSDELKYATLVEEIGHHKTTHGDILDKCNVSNCQQEQRARDWGAISVITLRDIQNLYMNPMVETANDAAEHLGMHVSLVKYAQRYYSRKDQI